MPKKTKTGQYFTAEDVLSYLAKDHPIVADILEWRSVNKLQSTYVKALPEEINPNTGRIRLQSSSCRHGRLSSNQPNLQNIPIRTGTRATGAKSLYPRDENHVLLAADYSQIELRIIAALSKIPLCSKPFNIHAFTAAKVFGVPREEVSRTAIKCKNSQLWDCYGVSAFGLSQQTNLNRTEAKELIEAYYATYPQLKSYMNEQDFARENGYVTTVLS